MKYVIVGTPEPEFVLRKLHEQAIIGGRMMTEEFCGDHLILTNLPPGTIVTCPCGKKTYGRLEIERIEARSVPPDGGY